MSFGALALLLGTATLLNSDHGRLADRETVMAASRPVELPPIIDRSWEAPSPEPHVLSPPVPSSITTSISNPVAGFAAHPRARSLPLEVAARSDIVTTGRDRFPSLVRNLLRRAETAPTSTFSIDVDTASYAFIRRQLNEGQLPPREAVRIEELINYFDYAYPVPTDRSEPFRPAVEIFTTPWNQKTLLLRIGIKGYVPPDAARPRANLVFLIDTSGSMKRADRLPLLVAGLREMVQALREDDTVAIVTYAGTAGTALEPTPVRERWKILEALGRLAADGSTAGGEGIRRAYALAQVGFDKAAINRVVLATDGDFNVGITDPDELQAFIERQRESGIYLSALGFGIGNYNDLLLQRLAQNGNGQAFYIDSLSEARRALVDGMTATLVPIARDVKIQLEFNPAHVAEYRLIGYETRLLTAPDFGNDAVDAGEIGAGHTVTALYELVPAGSAQVAGLRYARPVSVSGTDAPHPDELGLLSLRYKLPGETESRLIERPLLAAELPDGTAAASDDARFAAAVAAFGQRLRGGEHLQGYGYAEIAALAQGAKSADPDGRRAEFVNLVRSAAAVSTMETLPR